MTGALPPRTLELFELLELELLEPLGLLELVVPLSVLVTLDATARIDCVAGLEELLEELDDDDESMSVAEVVVRRR